MHKILFATDLSPRAERAGRRAVRLVQRLSGELRVVHVIEADLEEETLRRVFRGGPGAGEVAKELIHKAEEAIGEAITALSVGETPRYTTHCPFGHGHPEICAQAQEWPADLVVVGAHGRHALRDLFLGTTAENLVHELDRPVLVVKSEVEADYRRVLVPVDFSARSWHAVEHAAALAPDAEIELLHVFDSSPLERIDSSSSVGTHLQEAIVEGCKEGEERLAAFVESLDTAAPRVVAQLVRSGYPPREIVETAARNGSDLIVMGTRGLSRWRGAVVGSVARRVMQQAECDVVLERGSR